MYNDVVRRATEHGFRGSEPKHRRSQNSFSISTVDPWGLSGRGWCPSAPGKTGLVSWNPGRTGSQLLVQRGLWLCLFLGQSC